MLNEIKEAKPVTVSAEEASKSKLLDEIKEAKAVTLTEDDKSKDTVVPPGGGKMWVHQPGQVSFEIVWEEGDKIRDLKAEIERVTGVPTDKQTLRYNGMALGVDGQVLQGIKIESEVGIWVLDERDDSDLGYYSGPNEDDNLDFNGTKAVIYSITIGMVLFIAAQQLGVNDLAYWPNPPPNSGIPIWTGGSWGRDRDRSDLQNPIERANELEAKAKRDKELREKARIARIEAYEAKQRADQLAREAAAQAQIAGKAAAEAAKDGVDAAEEAARIAAEKAREAAALKPPLKSFYDYFSPRF